MSKNNTSKEYAIKIENPEHGLLFHFTATEEEAKRTKIGVGSLELKISKENCEVEYVDARYLSLFDLFNLSRGSKDGGEFEIIT